LPTNPPPRIAIPMPHSIDREYAERAIPQYERAVEQAGGEPVRIPLDQASADAMKHEVLQVMESCDGVLLPGSNADVDPSKFGAQRSPHTSAADPRRDTADQLLLQDAYNRHKPILGICYGLQSLNIYRAGSLIQHIPDFLPEDLRTKINHEAGRTIPVAHTVEIESNSMLGEILRGSENRMIPVNSSHHQSAHTMGRGLRIAARCPDDGIIEALEGTDPNHFVLAVQWHPERSVDQDEPSRDIFRALIHAAQR
jgi:putative glutamine amidotransferase